MEKSEADIVREIVNQALGFGIELLSLVELMDAQNSNSVNTNLVKAGLQNPLISIRNATVTRIVLMVAREYSKPRRTDRNLHRALICWASPQFETSSATARRRWSRRKNTSENARMTSAW